MQAAAIRPSTRARLRAPTYGPACGRAGFNSGSTTEGRSNSRCTSITFDAVTAASTHARPRRQSSTGSIVAGEERPVLLQLKLDHEGSRAPYRGGSRAGAPVPMRSSWPSFNSGSTNGGSRAPRSSCIQRAASSFNSGSTTDTDAVEQAVMRRRCLLATALQLALDYRGSRAGPGTPPLSCGCFNSGSTTQHPSPASRNRRTAASRALQLPPVSGDVVVPSTRTPTTEAVEPPTA